MIGAIPHFRESPLFTAAEKAVLRLAEAMAGEKQGPYDEIFADLRKYDREKQIVVLGWKTGIWLGYGRRLSAGRTRGPGFMPDSPQSSIWLAKTVWKEDERASGTWLQ
jgi:hypothetical protein